MITLKILLWSCAIGAIVLGLMIRKELKERD